MVSGRMKITAYLPKARIQEQANSELPPGIGVVTMIDNAPRILRIQTQLEAAIARKEKELAELKRQLAELKAQFV